MTIRSAVIGIGLVLVAFAVTMFIKLLMLPDKANGLGAIPYVFHLTLASPLFWIIALAIFALSAYLRRSRLPA